MPFKVRILKMTTQCERSLKRTVGTGSDRADIDGSLTQG